MGQESAQYDRLMREAEQHRRWVMQQGTELAARIGSRIVARYAKKAKWEYEELKMKALLYEVFKKKEAV